MQNLPQNQQHLQKNIYQNNPHFKLNAATQFSRYKYQNQEYHIQ